MILNNYVVCYHVSFTLIGNHINLKNTFDRECTNLLQTFTSLALCSASDFCIPSSRAEQGSKLVSEPSFALNNDHDNSYNNIDNDGLIMPS